MNEPTACPNDHDLKQAQAGRLGAERLAEIARHAQTCARCGSLLSVYETTFLPGVRPAESTAGPAPFDSPRPARRDSQNICDAESTTDHRPTAVFPEAPVIDATGALSSIDFDSGRELPADAPVIAALRGVPGTRNRSSPSLEITGEIARGGMGAVLHGHDNSLHRDVAVKVLLESHQGKTELLQRFVEEAQIHGQLQHPGVAPIYQVGEFPDKRPYFTMKLVKGKTLAKLLADRRDAAEDRPKFIGIFEQICQTLAYAHSRRVIHRDLKPANVMVGAFGEVQVMDWGLAKVLTEAGANEPERAVGVAAAAISVIRTLRTGGSSVDGDSGSGSQTRAGSVLGTPAYMPPEQALGEVERLDERADVFGLGAILCEILTGKPPYVGNDGSQIWRKATRADLGDAFSRLGNCGAEADLTALARRCLAAEPADRPRDAQELARELSDFQEGVQEKLRVAELQRVEAQARVEEEAKRRVLSDQLATEALARVQAESKRRRAMLALVASMLLTALAAVGSLLWFQKREADIAHRDAQKQQQEAESERLRNDELVRLNQQIEAERKAASAQAAISKDASFRAKSQQERAERQALRARAVALATGSRQLQAIDGQRSLGLAIEAVESTTRNGDPPTIPARQALRDSLSNVGGKPLSGEGWNAYHGVLSQDGRWLAGISETGPARLWDLLQSVPPEGGRTLGTDVSNDVRIVISPDGRWLITVDDGNQAKLYDLTSGDATKPVVRWSLSMNQAGGGCSGLAVSPDSGYAAAIWAGKSESSDTSTGAGKIIWSWLKLDPKDSRQEIRELAVDDSGLNAAEISFGQDGRRMVASIFNSDLVLFWDVDGSTSPLRSLSGSNPGAQFVFSKFSGNERWLSIYHPIDGIVLFDIAAADPLATRQVLLDRDSLGNLRGLEFSRDSRWLIANGKKSEMRIWNLDLGGQPNVLNPLNGTDSGAGATAETRYDLPCWFTSRSGRWLVSGTAPTRIWNLTADDPSSTEETIGFATNPLLPDPVSAGNSEDAVCTCDDHGGSFWRLDGERPLRPAFQFLNQEFVKFSRWIPLPDSPFLAFATRNGTQREGEVIHVLDTRTTDLRASERILAGHGGRVLDAKLSADHTRLLTIDSDGTMRLWSLGDAALDEEPITMRYHDRTTHFQHTIAGGVRFVVAPTNQIWIWDSLHPETTGESSELQLPVETHAVENRWDLSLDSRWVVVNQSLWQLHDGAQSAASIALPQFDATMAPFGFSPDSRLCVFSDATGRSFWRVNLDETGSGRFQPQPFLVLPSAITTSEHSRNGRFWVLADDQTGYVYDLQSRENAPLPKLVKPTKGRLTRVAASNDGHWIGSLRDDGAAKRFELWAIRERTEVDTPTISIPCDGNYGYEGIGFFQDDRYVALGASGAIRIWELPEEGDAAISQPPISARIPPEAFLESRDGRWLFAISSEDVNAIDMKSEPPGAKSIGLHSDRRLQANFSKISPDGRWLGVATMENSCVMLWDLREIPGGVDTDPRGTILAISPIVVRHHRSAAATGPFDCVEFAFSSDSRRLLTLSSDGRLRSHLLDDAELLANARGAGAGLPESEIERYLGEHYTRATRRISVKPIGELASPGSWIEALDREIEVDCENCPLDLVVDELRELLKLPVVIDHETLQKSPLRFDTPVSLQVTGVSVRTVLQILLEPFHLGTRLDDGILRVTSASCENVSQLPRTQTQRERRHRIEQWLKMGVSFNRQQLYLWDAVSQVVSSSGGNFFVDDLASRVLKDSFRVPPIDLGADQEPLESVLTRLLTPFHLRYVLHDDLIRITTIPPSNEP